MREFDEDATSSPYSRKVGERLRVIRRQKRLSLQEVEASSTEEFKASVLGAYERHLASERDLTAHTVRAYVGDVAGLLEHAARLGVADVAMCTASTSAVGPSYSEAFETSSPVSSQIIDWYSNSAWRTPWDSSGWYGV